jgi:hypothetical protein
LPATQPHFTFIGLENISFMCHLHKDTRSLAITIFIKEKPVNNESKDQEEYKKKHSGKAFVTFKAGRRSRGNRLKILRVIF